MLKIPLTFLLFLFSHFLFAQKFLITEAGQNIAYYKSENSLNVLVEGVACNSIDLETTNGKIKRDSCNFIYTPDSLGTSRIEVFINLNGQRKKIGESGFQVKKTLPPAPKIAGHKIGRILKVELCNQTYIGADYGDFDIEPTPRIDSFYIIGIRNDNILFGLLNKGSKFDKEILDNFRMLTANDKIIVCQIWATDPYGEKIELSNIELTVY
jgi:hypothetical protein